MSEHIANEVQRGAVEEVASISVLCRDQLYHGPPSKQARPKKFEEPQMLLQRTKSHRYRVTGTAALSEALSSAQLGVASA
jgi:hypothetical protein